VNFGLIAGLLAHGEAPVIAPSVEAGSPRVSVLGYGALKIFGNWVPGWPAAISARPESGPNENMNVWVPSPSVIYPSPPEICWHLMAPFTVPAVGVTKPPVVPAGAVVGTVNCVGPLYAGSELFAPGCVIVLVGHCTRNDCALAAAAAKATMSTGIQTWYDFLMVVQWLMVVLLRGAL
jgi:hypothetical protein